MYDIIAQGQLPAFVYDEMGIELVEYEPTGGRPVTGQSIYAYGEDIEKLPPLQESLSIAESHPSMLRT